jgi:hypothetical protein
MRTYVSCLSMTLFVGSLGGLPACSPSGDPGAAEDLPAGWSGALHVADLVQVECASSDMAFNDENASFTAGVSILAVAYDQAHFRCEQDVEGFYKVTGGALDMLVQPIDMHPAAVAACDCAYGITFTVKPVESGAFQATLYRRWDAMNSPNDPVRIASEQVTIE